MRARNAPASPDRNLAVAALFWERSVPVAAHLTLAARFARKISAMAQYDYHELKHTKVGELREIASKLDPPVEGFSQLNKDQLIPKICERLHIDMHAHHEVQGIDKEPIKKQIRELKKTRDEAIAAKDRKKTKEMRRRIHGLKRRLHAATV